MVALSRPLIAGTNELNRYRAGTPAVVAIKEALRCCVIGLDWGFDLLPD